MTYIYIYIYNHTDTSTTLHARVGRAQAPELFTYRMAGHFGGLLKICHLAEFTLAVEPGLAIMIFITKWLLKRARILIGP